MIDRHQAMLAKLPALLRKAAALREKFGQPARGAPVEQRRERARVPLAEIKARADRDHKIVMQLIAEHRARPRVHGLEPLTDADTWADDVAASVMSAAATRDRGGPPLPKLDGIAADIIRAGKIRRGEI
jgi:hypothetical protein